MIAARAVSKGIVAALIVVLLAVGVPAADLASPFVDLEQLFSAPEPDTILGPAVIACTDAGVGCFSFPDTLESVQAGGTRVRLDEVAQAHIGDYLLGNPDEVGLEVTDALLKSAMQYGEQASTEYEVWFNADFPVAHNLSGPPELLDLPESARASILAYAKTAPGKACSIAVRAYRDARAADTSPERDGLLLLLQVSYRRACLAPADLSQLSEVFHRLVYFIDGDVVACGGILVEKNLVLTARHCFAPGEESWITRFQKNNFMPPDLAVAQVPGRVAVVLGAPGVFTIDIPDEAYNPSLDRYNPVTDASRDFLFVRLVGYLGDDAPLPLAKADPGIPLRIPALMMTGTALLGASRSGATNELKQEFDAIKVDASPNCVVMVHKGTCVAHNCQSEQGFSGTPIFSLGAAGVGLVAVHTGSFWPTNPPVIPPACGFSRGPYIRNYGVVPESSLFEAAIR